MAPATEYIVYTAYSDGSCQPMCILYIQLIAATSHCVYTIQLLFPRCMAKDQRIFHVCILYTYRHHRGDDIIWSCLRTYITDCTSLQSDNDKMLNWTTVDLMSFKTSKCKQMIISRKKSQHVAFALSLGGQVLEIVNHYKYLGFCLLADLSWSAYSVYLHQSQKNHGHPLPTVFKQCG